MKAVTQMRPCDAPCDVGHDAESSGGCAGLFKGTPCGKGRDSDERGYAGLSKEMPCNEGRDLNEGRCAGRPSPARGALTDT